MAWRASHTSSSIPYWEGIWSRSVLPSEIHSVKVMMRIIGGSDLRPPSTCSIVVDIVLFLPLYISTEDDQPNEVWGDLQVDLCKLVYYATACKKRAALPCPLYHRCYCHGDMATSWWMRPLCLFQLLVWLVNPATWTTGGLLRRMSTTSEVFDMSIE